MEELLQTLDGPQVLALFLGLMGILGGTIVIVTAIAVPQWRRVREAEAEARLKEELLASGLPADEIERIICATARTGARRERERSGRRG